MAYHSSSKRHQYFRTALAILSECLHLQAEWRYWGRRAHLFLRLPGPAPSEPGRAAARRTLLAQQVGSLPQLPREAEHWLPVFGSVVATRGVPTCWRGWWVRDAGRSLVSDSSATSRPEREAEGRKRRKERRRRIAIGQHSRESVPGRWWGTVSPAKPRREGVAETLGVSAGMGS